MMSNAKSGPAWAWRVKYLTPEEMFRLGVEILASHSVGGLIPLRSQSGWPTAVLIQGDDGTDAMPRSAAEALETLGWIRVEDRPSGMHGWLFLVPNADQPPAFRGLDRSAFIRQTEANLNPQPVAYA